MSAPIIYHKELFPGNKGIVDGVFRALQNEVPWVRRDETPRLEAYFNDVEVPYTYGQGRGVRTYDPLPPVEVVQWLKGMVQSATNTKFEVVFLNRYLNQKDQLGWHADDSPEMDDDRPIAIVTFGAEREIWFRENLAFARCACGAHVGEDHSLFCSAHQELDLAMTPTEASQRRALTVEKYTLHHGSLCLMLPGMQDTHEHRIPKAGFECGERISLTFRGYKHVDTSAT